jgi:hypothetical protein
LILGEILNWKRKSNAGVLIQRKTKFKIGNSIFVVKYMHTETKEEVEDRKKHNSSLVEKLKSIPEFK